MAWRGPFQPTLETAWLQAVARFRAADPLGPVWLLVPSRFLGFHLTRLLAHASGALNVHVLTFTDLADRLLVGRLAARRLPTVAEVLVLRQALRDAVAEDGYFAGVREARRFPGALAATLAELRTAGARPDDLDAAAATAASEEAGRTSAIKLRELAQIVRQAAATLTAAGFVHPTDVLWEAARTGDTGVLRDCAGLTVYGFTEWNGAERTLLRVATTTVATECFVPAEPGPGFELIDELVEWLGGEGFRIEQPEVPVPAGPRAWTARLFAPSAGSEVSTSGLEIVAAPGEEREVREIARRLMAAAAEGIPFEAMGVLVRRPETYRGAIRDVFGAAGIPYTWGVAPRLGETRAGRSLRLLVTARGEDFARAAVMDFLAAADLRRAPDGEGVQPAEWDRLSREAGIVAGRRNWRRGLARLARRAEAAAAAEMSAEEGQAVRAGPPAAAVTAFGIVVGRLLDATATIPDAAPAADLAARFLRAFRRLCRASEEADQVAGHLQALTALAPLGTPLTLEEFGEVLETVLDAPAEPGPEPREGKVFVGELHQALGLPFRLVALPGLVEQGFPAPPRADPILLDDERRRLHAQVAGGRPGLSLSTRRPAEERLAFRLAVTAAGERLLLTYPRIDPASGRPRVPSFFLLRVAEAATGRPHDFSALETFPPLRRVLLVPAPPEAVAAPLDAREWLLAQATRARAAGAAGRAACLRVAPRATPGRAALEAREHGSRVSGWDGLLPENLGPTLAAHNRPADAAVAATPLEAYAACPFRYYLAQTLRLARPVEPERALAMTPIDRGLLLHTVLARAYAAFGGAGLLPLSAATLPQARALLEATFTEVEAAFGPKGLAPFWAGERARLLADVLAALAAEARDEATAWVPTAFEVSFGAGETGPPVAHDLTSGRRLGFRGRIDRLDVSPDGTRARVVDYKGGRSAGGAGSRLAGGTALQLPIYRLAAEAVCRARGIEARIDEAQYYYLTRRGGRRRLRFTAEDWVTRRAEFERALEVILDGIAAGRFFQNPAPETCRTCDYQLACGPERERIAWAARKLDDPVRADYAELQAIE